MYSIPQNVKDECFQNWFLQQKRRIEMLQKEGLSRSEAIEMLKVLELDSISESIGHI